MDDAYAAGIIDGEGCIVVIRHPKHGVHYTAIDVGMTKKALHLLKALKGAYGGNVCRSRKATDRWDEAHTWHLHGDAAAAMLRRIKPHLRLKAEQARLGILIQEIRRSLIPPGMTYAKWTPDATERCERIRRRVQELNRKGPTLVLEPPVSGARLIAHHVAGEYVTTQRDLFSDLGWEKWSGPWPSSGIGSLGGFWTVDSSESPNVAAASLLSDILEPSNTPGLEKFYLSPRACRGILSRAVKRGRKLPTDLHAALSRVAARGDTA